MEKEWKANMYNCDPYIIAVNTYHKDKSHHKISGIHA